jgi:hypothetical protein
MEKVCFIISTIGEENSPERARADEKLELVYQPVLTEMGYTPIRADKESTPNSISRDIISRVIRSDLVVADVSDANPNVFYELAIRNAVKKAVIVIKGPSQKLPFDIIDKRAIVLDMTNNRQWVSAKKQLAEHIKNAEKDPDKASESIVSDFTFSIDQQKSRDPEQDISIHLKDIKDSIQQLNRKATFESKDDFSVSTKYPALECSMEKGDYKEGDTMKIVINASEARAFEFPVEIFLIQPDETILDSRRVYFAPETFGIKTPVGTVNKDTQKGRWKVLVSTPDKKGAGCNFTIH